MKTGDIIFDVSRDLNDQIEGAPYIRWTQDQLLSYLQEAVIELSAGYSQLFHKQVVVRLQTGDVWQEACDCTHILRVVGESTWDGKVIRRLTRQSDEDVFTWPGDVADKCARTQGTELSGYSISSIKDSQFKVYPPVAPGQSKYVLIECYAEPSTESMKSMDFDVPDRLVQAVKQWMLYRALIVDSENNPTIVQVADTHMKVYTALTQELHAESMKQEAKRDAGGSGVRAVQNGSSRQVSS